jgi:hypothetical protein
MAASLIISADGTSQRDWGFDAFVQALDHVAVLEVECADDDLSDA